MGVRELAVGGVNEERRRGLLRRRRQRRDAGHGGGKRVETDEAIVPLYFRVAEYCPLFVPGVFRVTPRSHFLIGLSTD